MYFTLITGASGGIGLELARVFAAKGHSLILVARRADKLAALERELEEKYSVRVEILRKDLSLSGAARELFNETQSRHLPVDILINNAGFGLYGYFADLDAGQESEMIRLNVLSLTELTQLFLAPMLERKSGKIFNVASTAAFQPGPLMAVYYATKAYVLSFSEAVASELQGSGVSVSVLCPGPTQSDFQQRASINMEIPLFKAGIMSAADVARIGYDGLMKGKRVMIPGFLNKITPLGARFFPRNLVTSLVRMLQESRKRSTISHS